MKKNILFLFAIAFSLIARSQSPSFKWKNVDPSHFKIDALKQKVSQNFFAPTVSQNQNEDIKKNPIPYVTRGIVPSSIDGMLCITVDPKKIDSKMLVEILISPLNYRMPNPFIPSPKNNR